MPEPKISPITIAAYRNLFEGSKHNYGQHTYGKNERGKKEEGRNVTIKDQLLTADQYRSHLDGKKGLGIIPIDSDNLCSFAVIDVDIYASGLTLYINAIERNDFPLVPSRSKSGGLHIYCFFKQKIQAKSARTLMQQFASLLSIDLYIKREQNRMVEIFPKQAKLQSGDVGTWINVPYYHANKTKMFAYHDGQELDIDTALEYAKKKRTTLNDAKAFIADIPWHDGPPCLQTINILNPLNAKSGGRNVYLFGVGVYQKKKDENFFEQAVFEANNSMTDSLPNDELENTVIQSVRRKDYTYKCNEHPCLTYCKRNVCKTREYGIGKEGGYFSELDYGTMTQVRTAEPYYEWQVKAQDQEEYMVLRFHSEDEIIKQDVFLRLCFRELHILPVKMKQTEWAKLVNQSLREIEVSIVEDDISPVSRFKTMLGDFLFSRAKAETREQIRQHRVFYDRSKDAYYFRSRDLVDFIFNAKNFRDFGPTRIHGVLKDMGAVSVRVRIDGNRQLRVYVVKNVDIHAYLDSDEDSPFEVDFAVAEEKEF